MSTIRPTITSGISRRTFVGGALATAAALALAAGTDAAPEAARAEDAADVPEPDEIDATGAVDGGVLGYYLTNPVGIEPFDAQENQGVEVVTNLYDTLAIWDWGNERVAPLAAES